MSSALSLSDMYSSIGYGPALGMLLGVSSHLIYFKHGEIHLQGPRLAILAVFSPALLFFLLNYILHFSFQISASATTSFFASFYGALFLSIVTYRFAFHPLCKFPGPRLARISKFYHMYLCRSENNYAILTRWHEQYGRIVRTGPSELSVLIPDAVPAFYGLQSTCKKSAWYDMGHPARSLHSTRDIEQHDRRRKIWDKGFSIKALREFESRELVHVRKLDELIAGNVGKEMNVSRVFNFFSFDVMSDLAFGEPFNMLQTQREHFALQILHDGQSQLSFISPVPWLAIILRRLPGILDGERRLMSWSMDQVKKRSQKEPENPDLMSWLLDAEINDKNGAQWGPSWLASDTRLIVVAGRYGFAAAHPQGSIRDTTAVSLTHIFFHLAQRPDEVQKLRRVLDPIFSSAGLIDDALLRNVDHLNGVINEALRLHPPVPSGLLRITPPQGLSVGDVFIPGNTTVSAPFHPLGRSEAAFDRPNDFIPERWYSQPELIRNKQAFAPFSLGRYSCIGKNYAWMELRAVTALLVHKYDVGLAPGEDGSDLLNHSLDAFTLFTNDLRLVFTTRA